MSAVISERKVTYRFGLGQTMCEPIAKILHTGYWLQLRKGITGRFPAGRIFHTDCGKKFASMPHDNCSHNFTECPECKIHSSLETE